MDPDDATQPAYEVRPVTIPRRSTVRPVLALGLAAILVGLVVVKPWGWMGEPRSPAVAIAAHRRSTPAAVADPTAAVTPDAPIPTTPGWPVLAQAGDPLGDPAVRLPLTIGSLARRSGTWGVGDAGLGPRIEREEPWADWVPVKPEAATDSPIYVVLWPGTTICAGVPRLLDQSAVLRRDVLPGAAGGSPARGVVDRRRSGGIARWLSIRSPGRRPAIAACSERPRAVAGGPLRVPCRGRWPSPTRSRICIPAEGSAEPRRRIVVSTARPPQPGVRRTKVNPMTPLRTLGALALGATIVAVAALTVRSAGRRSARHGRRTDTITVSASGKVTIVPDVARVQLGVTIARPTVKAARDAGARAMTDILATIKSLCIADADMQTTNVSLYPQYGNGSPAKVVGYQISEQIQVTVRDLDKTGT